MGAPMAGAGTAGPVARPVVRGSARTTFGLLMVLFLLLGAGILAGRLHHQGAPASPVVPGAAPLAVHGAITSAATSPRCASAPNGVHTGATVIILDPNGKVLATTSLGSGVQVPGGGCQWSYTVTVPSTQAYQVQVAGLPPVPMTRAQVQRSHGRFTQQDVQPQQGANPLDSGM